jgi:hypothetical protein
MRKLIKQKYEATIIHQEALIEILRARLCHGEHQFVIAETSYRPSNSPAGVEIDIRERSVCTVCELVKVKVN